MSAYESTPPPEIGRGGLWEEKIRTGPPRGAGTDREGGLDVKRLVIDTRVVKNNLQTIKKRVGGVPIYAVLTADARGAGFLQMAELLHASGLTRFAVSEPGEAQALRKAGLVEEEILMLRSTANRSELEELMDLGVVCSIGSPEAGMALNALAEGRSTVAEAHVQVDMGTGYGGLVSSEPDKILSMFQNLQNVAISGIYTHFQPVSSRKKAEAQLAEFSALVQSIQRAGFETGTVHAAGSYSTLHYDFSHLGAVRVGSALLGRCRRAKEGGLQQVGFCEATIEDIRWLPAGHTVGYDAPVRLKRPIRAATLAVGYQNGLGVTAARPSSLLELLRRWRGKDKPAARIGNQRVKIVGQVGAMETLIDVTGLKCSPGDLVQLELDPLYAKGMSKVYR